MRVKSARPPGGVAFGKRGCGEEVVDVTEEQSAGDDPRTVDEDVARMWEHQDS